MARQPLPIDPHLGAIVRALGERGALVIVAEPGAGKTTRVPWAILEANLAGAGEVVVLEPRRLAARLAARRVAGEIGERVGERVGFQVRFDEVAGPRTRLRFVTEGILARRLSGDPALAGIGVAVLDEFHERHLDGDLALAHLARLRRTRRPDLKLVVMSATLDAEPVARFLGAEVVRVPGRAHQVTIEHAPREAEWPLEKQVAQAVRRLAQAGGDGDLLVFLPGAAEIRRAQAACADAARDFDLQLEVLHGEMALEAQEAAIARGRRRKVILSTNVAESAITVEGVTAVVDSGLFKRARHSPWSGLAVLEVAKVSQAQAVQRAGRAGRLRDGACVRLYTRADFEQRPAHDAPEIARADLAQAVLELRAAGEDPAVYPWFEAPPAAATAAADDLLGRLGALDGDRAITPLGRRMLDLPLPPRLARLVLAAAERGAAARGALVAAAAMERELRADLRFGARRDKRADSVGGSDLIARAEAFEAAARAGAITPQRARANGLDPGAAIAVGRARDQIVRALGRGSERGAKRADDDGPLLLATLAAFPDRVARRRAPHSLDLVLADGGAARLAEESVVREAELLVGVEAEERRGGQPLVRLASAVEPEWLLELFADRLIDRRSVRFDAASERVVVETALAYGQIALTENTAEPGEADRAEATGVLSQAALAAGPSRFADREALDRLCDRAAFARTVAPDLSPLDDEAVAAALVSLCEGRTRFSELEGALLPELRSRLGGGARRIDELAPERLTLPGGRAARIEYPRGQPPHIGSRLQDFFGMREGPRVGGGRVALVLHLLAPNQRPVQVTQDLAGFWERHYPALRRELGRRYPKHAWPEDPLSARPPSPARR